ncbi:hypothetical protein FRB99_008313 [Tulasnella sp. 403]|nr:hypothetical protein FRB99_008313 [Tulasnella sp. 403]
MDFDVIPYEDIKGDWKKLGSGSFGNVYKASYLGIDVAIKEVLPSNEYDVRKYFEREWRLMKEARHPNVVLYLGLSRAPPPDGRIFIISEFIEGGNLRQYIYDKTKAFGWRLRLSFMTDIARALAYLHARKCIHRDMKGENLLVTSNLRLKITDFGFARIAARNEEESKRLTFCGTDSYMSPEILLGEEFDLPTDVFSLGVIFCEIIARKLADDYTFKRTAPFFGIDDIQVRKLASPGCPPALIDLALECCQTRPTARPLMVDVLSRLRAIEVEVATRAETEVEHVGSIKFSKRPSAPPRIPSFGSGVMKSIAAPELVEESSDSDEELAAAMQGLASISVGGGSRTAAGDITTSSWIAPSAFNNTSRITGETEAEQPLIDLTSSSRRASVIPDYSTTVIKSHGRGNAGLPSMSSRASIVTLRDPEGIIPVIPQSADSLLSIDSYHTAKGLPSVMAPSIAAATEGSTMSAISASPSAMHHRFTLIKPGAKRSNSSNPTAAAANHVGSSDSSVNSPVSNTPTTAVWSPFDFFFFTGGLGAFGAKCDLCGKRLGFKAILECDDCGLRAHLRCGDEAPNDCGLRPPRSQIHADPSPISMSPIKGNKKLNAVASSSMPNIPTPSK